MKTQRGATTTPLSLPLLLLLLPLLLSPLPTSASLSRSKYKSALGSVAISDVNILLPASKHQKVTHRIYTEGGCFQWSASNDIVVLEERNLETSGEGECSDAVDVSIAPSFVFTTRSHTWIQAVEARTGKILTCEVYVDRISKIAIETTTRTMFKGDLERLTVLAFDEVGNLFSNIEGLKFQWTINPVHSVLQLAQDGIADAIVTGEDVGSHEVFVQAENIGTAIVTAQLVEEGMSQRTEVSIDVVINLDIEPQITIAAPGARPHYSLFTYQRNSKPEQIPIPDPHYHWSTSDEKVAAIQNNGVAKTVEVGSGRVMVRYRSLGGERGGGTESSASASLQVVLPHHIGLQISLVSSPSGAAGEGPLGSLILVVGWEYLIDIVVYTSESAKFTLTDNLVFGASYPSSHLRILSQSDNLKSTKVEALGVGIVDVSSTLKSYKIDRSEVPFDPYLTAHLTVPITDPVEVKPERVRLLCGDMEEEHTFPLSATGGTGAYEWYSSDEKVVGVDSEGVLTSMRAGVATVTVRDGKNPVNYGQTQVECMPPHSLQLSADRYEVEIGQPIKLFLNVLGEDGKRYDNCPSLSSSSWELSDNSVFNLQNTKMEKEDDEDWCTAQLYFAVKEGSSRVSVHYRSLSAEITIFAFRPLTVVSPLPYGLVTLGTSVVVTFEGGPEPWSANPNIFFVRTGEKEGVRVKRVVSDYPKRYSYSVTCLSHASHSLTLEVGNNHPDGVQTLASATAEIRCEVPTSLVVHPSEEEGVALAIPSICPDSWKMTSGQFEGLTTVLPSLCSLRNDRDVSMSVTVYNSEGRKFTEFSSLQFEWESKNTQKLRLRRSGFASRVLELSKEQGSVEMVVKAVVFSEEILRASQVPLSSQTYALTDLRNINLKRIYELTLLPNVALSPASVTLLNHPENSANLIIKGGSGFFSESANDTIPLTMNDRLLTLASPSQPAVVEVKVEDGCLGGSNPAYSVVHFSDIQRVEVVIKPLVELDKTLKMQVIAYDDFGNAFQDSQLEFISLTVHADDCLQVTKLANEGPGSYEVRGTKVATGIVVAVVGAKGSADTVTSDPKEVVVFPPFKLIPQSLYLLPEAGFQVQYAGGPPFRPEITFSVDKQSICSVDSQGFVVGERIGATTLRASMQSYSVPDTVYYDEITITVADPKVFISLPAAKLLVGQEMEASLRGLSGEFTPFSFGSLALEYEWSVGDDDVATWKSLYSNQIGEEEEETFLGDFSVRLVGKKAGRTRVSARVMKRGWGEAGVMYQAETSLIVYEHLKLLSPEVVLVTPSSSFRIRTNKDHLGHLTYNLLVEEESCGQEGTEDQESHSRILEVSPHGEVVTFGRTGEVFIQVVDDIGTSIVVHVVVKPVAMIEVLPLPPLHFNMAVKEVAEFEVVVKDDIGQRFHHSEHFTITTLLNKYHVVNINPGNSSMEGILTSIRVTALQPGDVILQVSVSEKEVKPTYIRIRVGEELSPSSSILHIGCDSTLSLPSSASSPSSSSSSSYFLGGKGNNNKGKWWSSAKGVVGVEEGAVGGKGVGRGTVFYDGEEGYYSSPVDVVQITSIELDGTLSKPLSNYDTDKFRSSTFRFPLRFSSGSTLLSTPPSSNDVRVECSVEESVWATAYHRRQDSGAHTCLLQLFSPSEIPTLRLPSIPSSLHLKVVAQDQQQTYNTTKVFEIPFSPAFMVVEPSVKLSIIQQSVDIHVLSDKTLEASVEKTQLLQVTRNEAFQFDRMVLYTITVLSPSASFSSSVLFHDPSSGQTERVLVVYESEVVMRTVGGGEGGAGGTVGGGSGGVVGSKEVVRGSEYMLMPAQRGGQGVFSSDEGFFPLTFTEMVGLMTLIIAIIYLLSRKENPPPRPIVNQPGSPASPRSPFASPNSRYGGFRSPPNDRYYPGSPF